MSRGAIPFKFCGQSWAEPFVRLNPRAARVRNPSGQGVDTKARPVRAWRQSRGQPEIKGADERNDPTIEAAGYARWTGPLIAAALGDVDVQYVWRS